MKSPFELLEDIAESTAATISGDNPHADTGYDLWVEDLVLGTGTYPYAKKVKVGIIDMGDSWQGSFVWDDTEGWTNEYSLDPYEMVERIIEHRRNGGR